MDENKRRALFETWTNGNRKDVIDATVSYGPLQAALTGMYFAQWFKDSQHDQDVFARMIEARLQ